MEAFMRFAALMLGIALAGAGCPLAAQELPTIKLAYAKCAHCTPLALVPEHANGIKVDAIGFNTGSDALTALVSKNVDVAQTTYLSFATAIDRGFDVVAISGHVNGGSQILVGNSLPLSPDDWEGLKRFVSEYKAAGKPFRVAASRGNAQDLHMRGELAKHGIVVDKDVQFVNIPNPSEHMQALLRGEVELICTVEPFATQIRQAGAAKFFNYPYDQAAGTLTGLIVTRSDVIAQRPRDLQSFVLAWLAVDDLISHDKRAWADVIVKVTGSPRTVAEGSIDNLFPDRKIYRDTAIAIADMMHDLKYISRDISKEVDQHIDYLFLEAATGKSKSELGY
jgi:ABC-type nitrate/sulfonate/bicarbonate transport system substrate-binding protein